MVWYLLRDFVWRNRQIYLFMAPLVGLFWVPVALGGGAPHWAIALSLFMAVTLGPLAAASTIGLREIRILPIEFRDLWTLTWVVSTVVPSALVLVTSAAALTAVGLFGGTLHVDPGTVVLAALYSFVYANAVLVLLPALNYVTRQVRPGPIKTTLTLTITTVFIGSMGLPYFLAPLLPLSISQLSSGPIAGLAMGVLGSFGVLAWRPTSGVGVGPVGRAQAPAVKPRVTQWPLERLTGFPRVLLPYLLTTAVMTVIVFAGSAWYASRFGETIPKVLGEYVSGMAYMFIGMTSPWMPWARLLKSLPLSARASAALLTVTPLAAWVTITITLTLLSLVFGAVLPNWFTPGAVVWFGGMSALVNALAFRNQGAIGWIVGPTAATGPFVRGLARDMLSPDSLWFLLAAALAFAAAAWINHRTMTRCGSSSRAFRKHAVAPFGISGPVAQR